MAPVGIQVEFGVGIKNKFALLSSEFDEGATKRKNKTGNKIKEGGPRNQTNLQKPLQCIQIPQQKDEKSDHVPIKKIEKLDLTADTEKSMEEKKSYVIQNFEKKAKNMEIKANKSVDLVKTQFNQDKKQNDNLDNRVSKHHNIKVQTIVVEAAKPSIADSNVVSDTTISENFHKENTRRTHFNSKQERLDKGNQTFDERGKRIYDRHSGQIKSSVKSSNIKKFDALKPDELRNSFEGTINSPVDIDNSKLEKSDGNSKQAIDSEEVSKEISYAEYKKNLALQGNVEITKLYSNNNQTTKNVFKLSSKLAEQTNDLVNLAKDNEKKKKSYNKVRKDTETIEIEIDSSVKNSESSFVRSNRPNNRNYNNRSSNFKQRTSTDRQKKYQSKEKIEHQNASVLNLVDDFPSL